MNTLELKGNWNIAKGKLKQKVGYIMDDDSQSTIGKEEELIGRIQKRAGQREKNIVSTVNECCNCKY
jgi:uncharacterized protein YjbJ (UPF0337 family)